MSSFRATVGILSIGDMGLGIAKLLGSENYRVVTNITGRSPETHARARSGNVELLSSDLELVKTSDYILSIVPPRDAHATATRVVTALSALASPQSGSGPTGESQSEKQTPLYYLDLNAISPRSARQISDLFQNSPVASSVRFIDGGIIGGPPTHKSSPPPTTTSTQPPASPGSNWTKPSIPVSGPYQLADKESGPKSGAHLSTLLNIKHISDEIGPASGLKMCFASTTKGFTAIAIQAFTTAHSLGVLSHLEKELEDFVPTQLNVARRGVTSMAPKAYRWVREMEEIADTHAEEGGFDRSPGLFEGVAGVYRAVADETVLGKEKTGDRKRGRTVEDVAVCVGEGLRKRAKRE